MVFRPCLANAINFSCVSVVVVFLRERRRGEGEADGEQDRWIKFLNGIFCGII